MTDDLSNKIAVKALAQTGRLNVPQNISPERAKELVRLGWARLNRNKRLLGITSDGRRAAVQGIPCR